MNRSEQRSAARSKRFRVRNRKQLAQRQRVLALGIAAEKVDTLVTAATDDLDAAIARVAATRPDRPLKLGRRRRQDLLQGLDADPTTPIQIHASWPSGSPQQAKAEAAGGHAPPAQRQT
jgi:hypothetical protein